LATSGSVNFNIARNDIIAEAMELIGAKDIGESPTAAEITSAARTLNIMIKGWQTEGVYMWKTRDFYVFPQYDTPTISLGPSGDHATLTYYKTEVATAASSGESTITVDSDDDVTNGDYIGIELDGGTMQWTTVNGIPAADVVTLTDALTDDVSVDANVFNYTTKINRPLFILPEGRVYEDSSSNEVPFSIYARNEYNRISTKTTTGMPNQGFYDPRTTNGTLYIWPRSDNVKNFLTLTGKFPIEDFDASSDDADMPQEWFLAITWNLACLIAPKFLHRSMDSAFEQKALMFLNSAIIGDKDWGSAYFEMDNS